MEAATRDWRYLASTKAKAVYVAYLLVPAHVLIKTYVKCNIAHVEFSNKDLPCKSYAKSHFFAKIRLVRATMRPHINGQIA